MGSESYNAGRQDRTSYNLVIQCQAARSYVIQDTPNPPTNIVGFRGFDSSIILI